MFGKIMLATKQVEAPVICTDEVSTLENLYIYFVAFVLWIRTRKLDISAWMRKWEIPTCILDTKRLTHHVPLEHSSTSLIISAIEIL